MKKLLFALLALLVLVMPAQALSVSSVGFTGNSTQTVDTSNGYMGSLQYNWSEPSGNTHTVVIRVSIYNASTASWTVYDEYSTNVTVSAGTGTVQIPVYANLTDGIPNGIYQISGYVCTRDSSGNIASTIGTATGSNSQMVAYNDPEPLPAPEGPPGPDPGTGTPIITPPIPPSGPIGPGTSIVYVNPPNGGN